MIIETVENPFLIALDEPGHAIKIRNILNDMLGFITSLNVDNEVAFKKVTSLYAQARQWKKAIEGKRKEMVEPYRKQTIAINDKAKALTDPLDKVIDIANSKVAAYNQLIESKKQLDDAALREAAAIFEASDELYIPPLQEVVRGEGAVVSKSVVKKFKLVDITKVPTKYLIVDETAILRDIKLGVLEIDGIEIYEETKTQLRTR
jgi:hypothetical protein